MSNNNDLDPAASTQMFQAFVERGKADTPSPAGRTTSGSSGSGKAIGIVVALVVIAAVVAFVALHK